MYRQGFAEDCLISAAPVDSIEQLPDKAKIGTSSLRRAVQLKRLRANIRVLPVRGNVETRLRLLEEKKIDALILAKAGLKRLGLEDKISVCFDPRQFIPAPAQGVLVVQTRTDDKVVRNLTAAVDDEQMRTITFAERQVLITTQCGCHAPVGAFAKIAGNDIIIDAFISDAEGENFIRRRTSGPAAKAQKLAEKTAQELLDAGGKEILASFEK